MNFVTAILTPLALLLPSVSGDGGEAAREAAMEPAQADWAAQAPWPEDATIPWDAVPVAQGWPFREVSRSFEPDPAWQVHIEQRLTIRISPRAPMPERPEVMMMMPQGEVGPRFVERRIGSCLPISRIIGVQPNGGSSLILFLTGNRMISSQLERGCRSRDFYSGFYLAPSQDGQLCVDRDQLQSRNGASCKLTRIRQLVETGN